MKTLDTHYTVAMQMADGCSDLPELDNLPEQRLTSTSTLDIPNELQQPARPNAYRLYPRHIQVRGQTPKELNTCPWATTVLERNLATGQVRARGVTCKRWGCDPCAGVKTRDLAQWIKLAAPNKLLTLTNDTKLDDNPELAWIRTAPLVPELIRILRKKFGSLEYLRVVELTKNNWPHYHLMIRSEYLPQAVLSNEWYRLSGSDIVDIRKVKDFFNSVLYLTKYLSKLRRVDWTERHISYSRKFFPVAIKPIPEKTEWSLLRKSKIEPNAYIYHVYPDRTLLQTAPLTYELPYEPTPSEEPTEPVPTEKQPTQQNMGF